MTHNLISPDLAHRIQEFFPERQADMEACIGALVGVESPSGDDAGSRAVVALLAERSGQLSCVQSCERVDVPGYGQHLVIGAFQQQGQTGNVLLVGHTDTVHSLGALAERTWRREGGRIYGPGIFDMK